MFENEMPSSATHRQSSLEPFAIAGGVQIKSESDTTLAAPERRRVDEDTKLAASSFLKRLGGRYTIVGAILYGSRARGDHAPDSDADIAVVLKGASGAKRERIDASLDMAGLAFHVLMDTGIMVQGFLLWESELARPETFSNPALIENILREGVRL